MTILRFVRPTGARRPLPPPQRSFRDPADVVASSELSLAEKRRMLADWEGSLRELLGACGHDPLTHRPGHPGNMYARVTQGLAALHRLRN